MTMFKTILLAVSIAFCVDASASASAYGDGDDPECPWGCLMKYTAQITEVRAYQHGADFPVAILTGMDECPDGGYIATDASNRSELVSLLLSAFHANSKVRLQVYKSKEWSSSTGPTHCMIRAVRLYK